MQETALVAAAKRGDEAAFAKLYERHRGRIFGHCYSMMKDYGKAEDVLQETFIKAWAALARFNGDSGFGTWVYRIAHNACIDALRKGRGLTVDYRDELENPDIEHPQAAVMRPDETLSGEDLRASLSAAIDDLSPDHRQILLLREVDGLSYEEIGARLGIPKGTVMSRLHHARRNAKEFLRLLAEAEQRQEERDLSKPKRRGGNKITKRDGRKRMLDRWLKIARKQCRGQIIDIERLCQSDLRPDTFDDEPARWARVLVDNAVQRGHFVRACASPEQWRVIDPNAVPGASRKQGTPREGEEVRTVSADELTEVWIAFRSAVAPGETIKASTLVDRSEHFGELGLRDTGLALSGLVNELVPRIQRGKNGYSYTECGVEARAEELRPDRDESECDERPARPPMTEAMLLETCKSRDFISMMRSIFMLMGFELMRYRDLRPSEHGYGKVEAYELVIRQLGAIARGIVEGVGKDGE